MTDGTSEGFSWGPVEVIPAYSVVRSNGRYRVIEVFRGDRVEVTLYVSPTGHVRVFRKGKEMK